jgi:hypothetical protein
MVRNWNLGLFLALTLTVAPAWAQPGGGQGGGGRGGFGGGMAGRGGPGTPFALLAVPAVQDELALSADQKTKAQTLMGEIREQMQGGFGDLQGLRDLPEAERLAKMAEFAQKREELTAKINTEYKPKFAEFLDEVQLTRLHQIYWQSQGGAALRDPELAGKLNLSQEQKDKIAATIRETQGRGFGGGPGGGPGGGQGGGNREEAMARMQEAREKRDAALLGTLTDEQKAQFEKLKGAAFDVSQLRGPGGPGGGPGGGRPDGSNRPNRPGTNL